MSDHPLSLKSQAEMPIVHEDLKNFQKKLLENIQIVT